MANQDIYGAIQHGQEFSNTGRKEGGESKAVFKVKLDPIMALDFIAGCFGGCAGVIIGHPFDTIKVKLQTQDHKNPVYRGTWDCFSKIMKTESVAGIYRGVWSPMAGVAVVNAIVFGVHGNMQRNLSEPNTLQSHFIAGSVAGLVQSVVASPVELVKTRVQTNKAYSSSTDCFKKTYKHEGVRGVFKGLGITGVREFLGYGLYFATYEALTRTSSGSHVSTGTMLMAGGLSGTVSWALTYPIDVIKSRYQADVGKYSGIVDCIKQSVRSEGIMCLTRGLTPTIIRAFPTNAVTFTVVSWVIRFIEISMSKTDEINNKINNAIRTLNNANYELKSLNLVEGTNSSIEIRCRFENVQPLKKRQKVAEDKKVDFEGVVDKQNLIDMLDTIIAEPSVAELNDATFLPEQTKNNNL